MCRALWLKGDKRLWEVLPSWAFGMGCFIFSLLAHSKRGEHPVRSQRRQGWSLPLLPGQVLCPIPRWGHPRQLHGAGGQEVAVLCGLWEGQGALLPPEKLFPNAKAQFSSALSGGSAPWEALGWQPSPTSLPWAVAAEQREAKPCITPVCSHHAWHEWHLGWTDWDGFFRGSSPSSRWICSLKMSETANKSEWS